MSQENVEAVLRGYEAFNRGDLDAAIEGFHPDLEWQGPEVLPEEDVYRGVEGVRRFWEQWLELFEDFQIEIEEVIDARENVVVMAVIRGRGRESGAEVRTPSFPHFWTIRDGKAIRMKMFPTKAAALEAAGLQQ